MNPESRIKLIRSLEEIRLFEQHNQSTTMKSLNKWGLIVAYFVVAFFAYGSELKQNMLMLLFMVIPTVAYSIWLSFKNKLDERHKVLATAVLELGSIAQEENLGVADSIQHEQTTVKSRKRSVKRKK